MSATKVLLGYGDGPGGGRLVEEAIKRAKGLDTLVVVVTSLLGHGELPGARAPEAEGGSAERYVDDIRAAERALAAVKEEFARAGVACDTHVLIHGQAPGQDLVEFARRHQVDEILIGARKHSRLGEVLAGSTERYVTAHAPCPVILVPID